MNYWLGIIMKTTKFDKRLKLNMRIGLIYKPIILLVLFVSVFVNSGYALNEINSALLGPFTQGQTLNYCTTDGEDLLTGITPSGGTFSGPFLYNISGNTANIDPSAIGAAVFTIRYQGQSYTVNITDPAVGVTLAPFAPNNYCENDGAFVLTGGNPADPTGTYWVDGVATVQFDPATVGPGVHNIQYSVGTGTCIGYSTPQLITVYAVTPATLILPVKDVCISDAPLTLSGGNPLGGLYSGTSVAGGNFDPSVGPGTYTITYTYTNAANCVSTATDNIVVHPEPSNRTCTRTNYCLGGAGGTITVPLSEAGVTYNLINNATLANEGSLPGIAGTNITFTGISAGDYFVRAVNSMVSSCFVDFNLLNISVNPLPGLAPSATDPDFCIGGTTQIFANPTVPADITNYVWSSGEMISSPVVAPVSTTNYIVTITDNNGCKNKDSVSVTIYPLPTVGFTLPVTNVCVDASAFVITGGSGTPLGGVGVYSGTGVGGGLFDPAAATPGTYTLTYQYTDPNTCVNTATDNITVNPLPAVGINNLLTKHCDIDPIDPFEGSPQVLNPGESGVFSGLNSGLTDNGDGTAVYDPANTGLGSYTITYKFTDANGCSDTASQNTRTGTELHLVGLKDTYCDNEGITTFNYTPGVSSFPGGDTLFVSPASTTFVDNLGSPATADFNPSGELPNTYTFRYEYYDDIGCENIITKDVDVRASPTSSFEGLSSPYCASAADDSLKGYPVPVGLAKGKFSATVTGLTDNNDGTAVFSPTLSVPGGPYSIKYSYTDVYGCSDSVSLPVTVNIDPVAKISGTATICQGAFTNLKVKFDSVSNYTVIYSDGSSTNTKSVVNLDSMIIAVNPSSTRTYTLVSVVDDLSGCSGFVSGSALITVRPVINITSDLSDVTVCEDSSAIFKVTATGATTLQYEWFFAGTSVQSGNSPMYIRPATLADDGKEVYCKITSTSCATFSATSLKPKLYVNETTTVTAITLTPNDTVCEGSGPSITVTDNGVNNTYQWQKYTAGAWGNIATDAHITDVTSPGLLIQNINSAYAGNYRCIVTGDCSFDISNPVTITVINKIAINTQPLDTTACSGGNVQFVIETNDDVNNTFVWFFDDGSGFVPIDSTRILVLNTIDATNIGDYKCEVTSKCGETLTSNLVYLDLYAPVVISKDPVTKSRCELSTVYFNVITTGDIVSYQWYHDGNPVGTNSNTLELLNVTQAADGGDYWCIVDGECNNPESGHATLTVDQGFTITKQPQSKTVCDNGLTSTSLSVTISPLSNQKYQWYKVGTGALAGKTTNTLNINPYTDAANAGQYFCVIKNACEDSLPSSKATLSTGTTVSLSPLASTLDECAGQDLQLSVTPAGTVDSLRWFKNGTMLFDGTRLQNTQTSTLDITSIKTSDNATYRCTAYGVCNTSGVNASVFLTVSDSVALTSNPLNDTVCEGYPATLSFACTGTEPKFYLWKRSDGNPVSVTDNLQTLTFSPAAVSDSGSYYCEVTNTCNSIPVITGNAHLKVDKIFSITSPVSVTQCEGSTAIFKVTADVPGLIYQWEDTTTGPLSNTAPFSGVNTPTLTISGITTAEAAVYRCLVIGTCDSIYSNPATLKVNKGVNISQQPASDSICYGEDVNLYAAATGSNLVYDWYKGTTLVKANSQLFDITGFDRTTDAGTYNCVVYNACSSASTDTIELYPADSTMVTNPTSKTRCEGSVVNFTVNATGSNLNYQWQFAGTSLTTGNPHYINVKGSTLGINDITSADEGLYTCLVTGTCTYSGPTPGASLTVADSVRILDNPINDTVCKGSDASFTVTVSSGNPTRYAWKQISGALPADSINSTLIFPGAVESNQGDYYCVISNGVCDSITSNTIHLEVEDSLKINPPLVASDTSCEGASIHFDVDASGPTNIYYQWYKASTPLLNITGKITGVNSASLGINNIVPGDGGSYNCKVTSVCGNSPQGPVVLKVNEDVDYIPLPLAQSVTLGGTATFTVTATGDTTGFQWYGVSHGILADGGNISGATKKKLVISNAALTDEDTYYCVISGLCNTVNTTGIDLTVISSSVISTQPDSIQTYCSDETLSLSIETSGTGHNYEWWRGSTQLINDGRILNADTKALTILNVTTADAGSYYCKITDVTPVETSKTSIVSIYPATQILTSPNDAVRCVGDLVTFAVSAKGGGILHYQWVNNSGDIPNDTLDTYTISPLADGDDNVIYCRVTGSCGLPVTSSSAKLVVNKPTVWVSDPADAGVCEGSSTALSLGVTGDSLTYQWYFGTTPITGANKINYTLANARLADEGLYSVKYQGICDLTPATSGSAYVTVNPQAAFTKSPINKTKCVGDQAVFTVKAVGSNLTYSWYYNGTAIPLTNNDSLTIASVAKTDEGSYTCHVTGDCGNEAISDPAYLTVNTPIVVVNPLASPICENTSTSISLGITGDVNTYQWYFNTTTVVTDTGGYSDSNAGTLIIDNATKAYEGYYNCVVTGGCSQSITTGGTYLTVNQATKITDQPISATTCNGADVEFQLSAVGVGLTYQWYKDGVSLGAGQTNYIISLPGVTSADNGAYTCVVTGSCGTVTSDQAILTVTDKPVVTNPTDVTVCETEGASFTITATGSSLNYQWKTSVGNTSLSNNTTYSGVKTNKLSITNATPTIAGGYYCAVTNLCGSVPSQPGYLNVKPATQITLQPQGDALCAGNNITFRVVATGKNLTYDWRFNNVSISGATDSVYTVPNIQPANAGDYTCLVSGDCGIVLSDPATLVVLPSGKVNTPLSDQYVCLDNQVIFTIDATGDNLTYQWIKDNTTPLSDDGNIVGSQTKELTINYTDFVHDGFYRCDITSTCGGNSSLTANLMVLDSTKITNQPVDQTVTIGGTAYFNVSATDSIIGYQWKFGSTDLVNNGTTILGANTPTLTLKNVSASEEGLYSCVVTGFCGTRTSDAGLLTVNVPIVINHSPSDTIICEGGIASFEVDATGVTAYQWYFGSNPITDATGPTLILNSVVPANSGVYTCKLTGTFGNIQNITANLQVREIARITANPTDETVCENSDLSFKVTATGYSLSYQWQKDGTNITDVGNRIGTNTNELIISGAGAADIGAYKCIVSSATCNTIESNPGSLSVNLLPDAAGTVTGKQTVCQGEQGVIYSVPEITNATGYTWDLPYGATISFGIGTRSIRVNYANNSQSGTISVHGQNSCGSGTESASIAITVNSLPVAFAGDDQLVCGETTSMAANSVTGAWSILSGDAVISNTTFYNTVVNNLKQGENQFIWTVTQNGCINQDTMSITNTTVTVDAGENKTVCSKTTNLQAYTPTTGAVWSVESGSGIIDDLSSPTSQVSSLSQGANQFAWVVNNMGCVSSDVVTITNDLPHVPNGGADHVVDFNQTTLDAEPTETGTVGTWSVLSGSGDFTDPNNPKTDISGLTPGVNVLLWTVQRNNCILADTVSVENTMIDVPEAGPNQTVCTNSTKLAAVNPDVGTGEWSVISGAATFADKYNNTSQVSNLGHGSNWLKWTVRTSGSGMEYDSVLIINNQATIANAGPDITICTDSVNLNANNPIYGTGLWTLNSGSGDIADLSDPVSAITNLGQGTNELKWTITNVNCVTEDFVKVTNNTPTTAEAGSDQTICLNETTLLPNTPSVGTGSWSLISGSGTFSENEVTRIAPDSNVYRYTITMGICKSTDDVVIVNNKPTTPYAGYDQNLCSDTVVLAGNAAIQGTGVWSVISGAGNFTSKTVNNPTVTGISEDLNIYRWTITNKGCTEFDEVQVTNNYVAANAGDDIDLCESSYQLLASTADPGTGTWSVVGSSGAIFTNQNNPNTTVTNLSNGENVLRWTVEHEGCLAYDDVVVGNYQPTDAFAGENQSICGKSATLHANIPEYGVGEWIVMSGSGNFDNTSSPWAVVSNLGEGQNTLRWTISNESCFSYDDVIVKNNLAENVFAGNDQVACSDTAVLEANIPKIGTGRWSIINGAGNFDNPNSNKTVIRNLGKGQNILKWTVSSGDCHVIDTVVISSTIPTRSVAGADRILCADSTILAGNTPTVGTGEWILVSGSAVIEDPTSPNSRVTAIQLGNTTLRWTISENGCFSDDELTLINNEPSKPFAGYDEEVCADSARLFAEPPTTGKGRWTLVSGDATIQNPDTNQTVVNNMKFNNNTFRWTVTNKNCVIYDDVVITNNYEYVNAGADKQVNSPSVQLVGNVPTKGKGEWKVSASDGTIETPDNFQTMVNSLGSGANIFTWTINNNGCISSDDIVISYVVMPVADFEPSEVKGCPPMLVNFVNSSTGGEPYHWDFGDGETSEDQSLYHIYNDPGVYKAVLTCTAPLGQTVEKDTFITVYTNPIADFEIAPDTIYVPGEHISCYNYSKDAASSQWFFGDGTYLDDFSPLYSYTDEGIYNITLKVTSKEGCVDSMTRINAVVVLPRSNFFFPQAFTPNPNGSSGGVYDPQDRSNDVFYPIVVDGDLDEYEMLVYNRSGVLLFKTKDVNKGWDGYYKNKMLPQDVYIYLVQGKYNNGQPFKMTGNVLLIVKDN